MKLGIVGLPNIGKTTLFNAITKSKAEATNYLFSTVEPSVGTVFVPDERLKVLSQMYHPKKTTYANIEFYDIAGLAKGASRGEGLGNKFLGHIREAAAIVHVVRCFEDPEVLHVEGKIDPVSDIESINLELIFSDIEVLERRIQKTEKNAKSDPSLKKELDILKKVMTFLEEGRSARAMELANDEAEFVKSLDLLSYKPVIYVANVDEKQMELQDEETHVKAIREFADTECSQVVAICAKIEAEISELDEEEKFAFLEELGIGASGLDKLIQASYSLLDLISFLTAGEPEVRAWTIKRGTKAQKAAGKIHSDIERGFIRAQTIAYDKLMECGSMATAKEKGLVRAEGKEYVVKDGDVIHFLFNV